MSQCDGSSVDIEFIFVKPHLLANCYGLRCKGFVGFDQVDVLHRQSGLFQRLCGGWNRSDTHDPRIDARRCVGLNGAKRLDPQFICFFLRHNDNGRSGVVEAGCVGCRYDAFFFKGRAQLADTLCRYSLFRIFVCIENDRISLSLRDLHRHDLVFEPACLDCRNSLLLGLCSKIIQLFSGQSPLFTDIFCGDAHVDIIECIGEAVL